MTSKKNYYYTKKNKKNEKNKTEHPNTLNPS